MRLYKSYQYGICYPVSTTNHVTTVRLQHALEVYILVVGKSTNTQHPNSGFLLINYFSAFSSTMCYSSGSIDQAVNPCPMCKVFPHPRSDI